MLKIPSGGSMVLLRTPGVEFDKQDAARRLAAVAGVPFYDAINIIGHHHGRIVAEDIDPGVAQRWADELAGMGLPVTVLHGENVLRPVFLGHALRVQYDDARLQISVDRVQMMVEMAWEELAVVAVGHVDVVEEDPVDFPVDPMPDGGYRPRSAPLSRSRVPEKILVVELYSETRCQAITLHAKHLTYTHLGPRMQPSSTDNMRRTLEDIMTRSPRAARTDGVDKFVKGCVLHDIHFADMGSFQEPSLWLLQARRQGWLGPGVLRPTNRFDALEL